MDISSIRGLACIPAGSSIDEEYKRILEKLIALGITPSGNKAADKAKLRQYEMQQLKSELGSNGKGNINKSDYITISASEIEQIKQMLQHNTEEENSPERKEIQKAAQNQTGATQTAALNQYFIKKRLL